MAFLKVKNRAISSLASGVNNTDTSWTLVAGGGDKFPTTGDFHVTCEEEIVKCTSRTGDVLTVTRSQEGTSAVTHSARKAVELRITAGVLDRIELSLASINVETLTDDKTLTPGIDKIYQYLDGDGVNRIIYIDTSMATDGDCFVIRNNGAFDDTHPLTVKQSTTTLDVIYAGGIKEFIFYGTDWISRGIGTGEKDDKKNNVAIGYGTSGYDYGLAIGCGALGYKWGVAVGWGATGYSSGVGIGRNAGGYIQGVAIGRNTDAHNYGVAVGYYANTNSKKYSIALGVYSKCYRTAETSININPDDYDQENNVVQGRWEGQLEGGAGATEIFCGGQADERFTIRPNSVLGFTVIIVARDNVSNEVARYSVHDGLIKRDDANNTVMVLCTVTVDHEDDVAWDCAVTADDVNDALIITVTGDGVNPTQWAAVMDGVETHF